MPAYWKIKFWSDEDRARVIDRLNRLRTFLAKEIPPRTARDTLLLATWNLRDFGGSRFNLGDRLPESLQYIAEVIASFDLVALQEINDNMKPFEDLMQLLGPTWEYIATDTTEGDGGNLERMVFVYDTTKVYFKHIAGEIVLPKDKRKKKPDKPELVDQFARTPFLVRFQSGWFKFYLCTVHLYYGASSGVKKQRRIEEIDKIAGNLAAKARKDGQNYILLGDMNIESPTDETMSALTKHKFVMPNDLVAEKIAFESNMSKDKIYDQIAFYVRKEELVLGPSRKNAGVLDFYQAVFTEEEFELYGELVKAVPKSGFGEDRAKWKKHFVSKWRTWQMSDHLPLWVELKIDFTDAYLERIRAGVQPLQPKTPDATEK